MKAPGSHCGPQRNHLIVKPGGAGGPPRGRAAGRLHLAYPRSVPVSWTLQDAPGAAFRRTQAVTRSSFTVRPAAPEDATALAALDAACHAEGSAGWSFGIYQVRCTPIHASHVGCQPHHSRQGSCCRGPPTRPRSSCQCALGHTELHCRAAPSDKRGACTLLYRHHLLALKCSMAFSSS